MGLFDRRRIQHDESGAYLVLFALLVTALLAMVAVVIDLSQLRQDRRGDRSASDAAAAAGATTLASLGGSPNSACKAAWRVAVRNLGLTVASYPTTPCDTSFPSSFVCTTTSSAMTAPNPVPTSANVGPFQLVIKYPVPDTDVLMRSERTGGDQLQAANATYDGGQCARVGVQIRRLRQPFFAKAVGFAPKTTDIHTVARGIREERPGGPPVALLVLEQKGCGSIVVTGTSQVIVEQNLASPGIIISDSDALLSGNYNPNANPPNFGCTSGSPPRVVIDAGGTSNVTAQTNTTTLEPGIIGVYALSLPAPSPARAYDGAPGPPPVNISPQPLPSLERITRKPVDKVYHCAYTSPAPPSPLPTTCTIPGSTASADHINELTNAYRSGVPATDYATGAAASFYTYPSDLHGITPGYVALLTANPGLIPQPWAACNMGPAVPAVVVPQGNWYVDCPAPGGFSLSNQVAFRGGTIVTAGSVSVSGANSAFCVNASIIIPVPTSGSLCASIAPPAIQDALVYVRGSFTKSSGGQSTMQLPQTFVHMDGEPYLGAFTATAGGQITWSGPVGGPFKKLMLWNEHNLDNGLGGGSDVNIDGVVFTPNARFNISGNGSSSQLNAQFIAKRLDVSGGGVLRMKPDASRIIELVSSRSQLIR